MVREDDAVGSFFKDYDNFICVPEATTGRWGLRNGKVYGEENNILYWAD